MLTENIRGKLADLMAAQEDVKRSLVYNHTPYKTQQFAHDSYHEMRSNVLLCIECGMTEEDVVARIDYYIARLSKLTNVGKENMA